MLHNKLLLRVLTNSFLGLALIFIWSRFINFLDIIQILKTTNLKFVFLYFLLFIFSGILRGMRLKLLLNKYKIPLKDAVMLHFLSQFLSFMIPVRAGEITKSVYLTSRLNLPLGKTITWVFIDRALDFMVILVLIALLLPAVPTNLPADFIKIILLVLAGFLLFFILAVKSEKFLKKMIVFLSNFLIIPSIKRWFISFTHTIIEGFEILRRHPLELFSLGSLTFLALVSDGFIWLAVYFALGIKFDIFRSILGNSIEAFAFLLPAAPGFVGSAEASGLAVFGGILGIEANQASAAVVLFHILTISILIILGILAIYTLKFDLKIVWRRLKGN